MVAVRLEGISKAYGATHAARDVDLEVKEGELVTLLGASGSGKTTCLRIVAGFIEPSAGRVLIGGEDVTRVPPHRRNTGMVFQHYALFPHLTVAENVAFGLEVRRLSRAEVGVRTREALRLVRLEGLAERRPGQLSGGQKQRVALARAVVISPRVLLLDEPLGALDQKLREELQGEIKRVQETLGITTIFVTHDQSEALSLSDRIVVMRDGVIEQAGTPTEIYARPRNAFVADFVGSSNLVRGKLRPDLAQDGLIALETPSGEIVLGDPCGRAPGAEPTFSIRTVHLQFSAARPEGTVNVWPVRVHRCVFQGDFTQIHVAWGDRDLVIRSAALQPIAEGQSAWISADPRRCVLLEAE